MARNKRNIKTINRTTGKSLDATGKVLGKLTTSQQPFVNGQMELMSTLIDSGMNCAVIAYKFRRIEWELSRYDIGRGDYLVCLLKDIVRLLIDISWAFISSLVYMVVTLVIYAVASFATILLIFYLLSRII